MFRQKNKLLASHSVQKSQKDRRDKDGQWLAVWLNDEPRTEDKMRVIKILGLLRQMERLRQEVSDDPNRERKQIAILGTVQARLRDLTFRYVTHPIFELPGSAAFIGGLRGKHIRSYHVFNYAEGQTQWEEAYALRIIEELLNCGWILSRLKNCETCARWVFHLKSGGKYCENKICKNEPYEAKPERVQRKRLTAKNNYHDAKERERRNLKRVKERGAR